jgi:hypothetical protein
LTYRQNLGGNIKTYPLSFAARSFLLFLCVVGLGLLHLVIVGSLLFVLGVALIIISLVLVRYLLLLRLCRLLRRGLVLWRSLLWFVFATTLVFVATKE